MSQTRPRLFVGLLVALVIVAYYTTFSGSGAQEEKMSPVNANAGPILGLKLTLKHARGSSPPIITAIVTNENSSPVTILGYDSPLDESALQLGLLKITPDGAKEPLQLPEIHVRRIWPPTIDALITIPAGESVQNEILLKEHVVPSEDLGEKATVELIGEWQAVWAKSKEDVSQPSLDDPRGASDSFSGTFDSGKLVLGT